MRGIGIDPLSLIEVFRFALTEYPSSVTTITTSDLIQTNSTFLFASSSTFTRLNRLGDLLDVFILLTEEPGSPLPTLFYQNGIANLHIISQQEKNPAIISNADDEDSKIGKIDKEVSRLKDLHFALASIELLLQCERLEPQRYITINLVRALMEGLTQAKDNKYRTMVSIPSNNSFLAMDIYIISYYLKLNQSVCLFGLFPS